MNHEIKLLKHQQQLLTMPWDNLTRMVEFFFLIGGYGCGKSMSDVALIMSIVQRYNGHYISVGVYSTTITLFRKTIWADWSKAMKQGGIPYHYDKQENSIQIGTITFYIIPITYPEDIFGPNVSISIVDEIDELNIDKCLVAFQAIQERTRAPLPDGRKPFSVFTTTAQGMRGAFKIVNSLKEKDIPHVIIRGHTILNTYIDPAYYQRLWDIYDEKERRAFLFGEFINLTSGRCYPAFSEPECVVDDLAIIDGETVHTGQDMNSNASCATSYVKRDKTLYIVKEFCFKDFTQAGKEIRTAFPTNHIPYYPDASGKMIIHAQMADFIQEGMVVMQSPVNPPIRERIFIVNKMLATGRLKICKSVKNLIMAWNTRCYDKNGDPEKATTHPENSDFCDSSEYALWRIVSSDPDFFDLYSLAKNHGR